jgi:quercetin dioxygenase-like cupin family protein
VNDEIHEDPVLRYRYRFSREGDVLHVEIWADPGGGVTIEHYHPKIEERFRVLEGQVTFKADGDTRVAGPGDEVVVPPGVRHTFRNTGADVAHLTTDAEPALELQEFLERAAALGRAGAYTRRGIPKGFGALLEAAEFADRYRETVVFTANTFPPPALQPILLGPLARLQRRRAERSPA